MQRLAPLDAQFLNVESPTTVGHVGSLIVLDPPTVHLGRRDALGWLIYPLIWLAYTLVRGAAVSWYPYPFLDPAHGGYGQVAVTSVAILVAGALVCLFYAWLGNRLGGKTRTAGLSRG